MVASMKHMSLNFAKLEKFEGVDFRRWQKKMHFLLSSMSVVYVLTTPMPEDGGDNPTVEQAKYMAEDASSKKVLVSNFTIYKMTDLLEQYNELLGILGRFTQHKINMDESIQISCIIDKLPPSWKDFKHTLKHLKEELTLIELDSHLRIEESLRAQDIDKPKGNNIVGPSVVNMDDDVAWWVDSGATVHVCKDRCWFKTYESLNDRSILHMENESTTLVHGRGYVDLRLIIVSDNIGSAFMSTSKLNNSILWHARLGHVHFKRMQDMSKDGLIHALDIDTEKTDRGGEYMDTLYFQSVGIIHETTAPYTPQQNGISERKNRVLKEMVNSMLSYSGLSQGFWGEAMLTACYLLNRVPNKRNMITPYELWTKKKPNLNYLRVWGCRAVVRLPDPKLKTLGERGIECIFVGYAEHSKAFRFFVIEPNESVTEEVVQQPEPKLKKSKRHRTPKDFGPEFQFYLIEGVRDEVSDQHSYCFNVEDDPKIFDKVADLLGCKWIFKRKLKVDRTVKKFKARLVIQGFRQKSRIGYFDNFAPIAPFLNGELDEEAPKQSHQKFDEVVLFNGYLLNQADKCIYSKFDESGKGVIICLYVDDMLIFCMTKLAHFISVYLFEKVLRKFKFTVTELQPDIAFVVGKLSRYTSNPGTQHWQAIQRVLKYLKKTMDYRLMYTGYPSVLEGYTDASWISNTEDNSSTSGWVFLLGGGAISWASKKQTCITGSTMKSKFMALAAAGKEAEWLKNLLLEIPLWVKPIAPISIRYDSVATLAKAYS
ncbi:zinc finger, CCHC-type containing protein [Tanacetum coccineum]